MRTLSELELFAVWEAGFDRGPVERALEMLDAAGSAEPARLPIGRRDALLIELRERLFGPRLAAATSCPACGEEQNFELRTQAIRLPSATAATEVSIALDDRMVRFRLPDTTDLLAIAARGSGEQETVDAKRMLLERCVVGMTPGTGDVSADDLTPAVVDAVSRVMAEADPQADVELSLDCAACGRAWTEAFDISSFLWIEIHAWAIRTLRDVHQLAASYGWTETDALSVGPWRRAHYLELIAG